MRPFDDGKRVHMANRVEEGIILQNTLAFLELIPTRRPSTSGRFITPSFSLSDKGPTTLPHLVIMHNSEFMSFKK